MVDTGRIIRNLPIATSILVIISYFLPWFWATASRNGASMTFSMNGLGSGPLRVLWGSSEYWYLIVWNMGILNTIGLVLSIAILLIYLTPRFGYELKYIEGRKREVLLGLSGGVLFLGFIYFLLFYAKVGSVKVLGGYVIDISMENLHSRLDTLVLPGIGFLIFLIAAGILFIYHFKPEWVDESLKRLIIVTQDIVDRKERKTAIEHTTTKSDTIEGRTDESSQINIETSDSTSNSTNS